MADAVATEDLTSVVDAPAKPRRGRKPNAAKLAVAPAAPAEDAPVATPVEEPAVAETAPLAAEAEPEVEPAAALTEVVEAIEEAAAPVVEAIAPAPKAKAPRAPKLAAPKAKPVKAAKPAAVKPAKVKAPRASKPIFPAAVAAPAVKAAVLPKKTAPFVSPFAQIKDTIMAKTTDIPTFIKTAFVDVKDKAKGAYDKTTAAVGEATEFAKGNVEAVVESGKILTAGLKDMGAEAVAEGKSAFETATADVKSLAAVKTPTEFFQLQQNLMKRNFDAAVAYSSKSSEAMVKLAGDAFAPLSSRMSLAVEKVSKAA